MEAISKKMYYDDIGFIFNKICIIYIINIMTNVVLLLRELWWNNRIV